MGLKKAWKRKPRNLPQKIMFWSVSHRPQDFAGLAEKAPPSRVHMVTVFLKTGSIDMAECGWAECRICGEKLGTKDMIADGYVWPELAEHYIEKHGVWTPKMNALGRALEVTYGCAP